MLALATMAMMGKVVSVRGLARSGGPVMTVVVDGSLARVFVRRGRAPVMGRVAVMRRVPDVMGGVSMRSGRGGGVMQMRAGRGAASHRMVAAVMC